MRKLLVALMIVAFAATAFADVKLSGTYNVNGIYKDNIADLDDGTSEDVNQYYEHEFKLKMKATTDKDTYFNAKLQLADNTWLADQSSDYSAGTDFEVERAYMGHNFGVAKLEVGLMDGGGWSYGFGNSVEGFYRIKAYVPAGPGNVIAIVEKNTESNAGSFDDDDNYITPNDAEKDDTDSYILGYTGKVAGFSIAPMVKYKTIGDKPATNQDTDITVMAFDMGVGGDVAGLTFEAEVVYQQYDVEAGDDYSLYGVYANVSKKIDKATAGLVVAYGSYDEDGGKGFDFGDNFDSDTLALIIGDELAIGSVTGQTGIAGFTVVAVYGDYAVNDKLKLAGSVVYAMANQNEGTYEDATAYEIDLGASYAITEALSYDVALAYAQVDRDASDLDPSMMIKHGLTLSF